MVSSDSRWVRWTTVAVSVLAGVALWEFGTRGISPAVISPFSATMLRLIEMIQTGELSSGVLGSLVLFLTGFGIAVATALPLGLLLARARIIRVALSDYIMVANATPLVALIPFILSIAGLDFRAKVLVVFLFSFFPILFNTVEGARSINPELIEVARSFRSGEWAIWRDIMVPGTLPYAMTGVRQAIGRALVGMVVAEFFLSASGMGQLLMTSARNFDTAALFGTVLIITLIGAALTALGRALENRFIQLNRDAEARGRPLHPGQLGADRSHARARVRRQAERHHPGAPSDDIWQSDSGWSGNDALGGDPGTTDCLGFGNNRRPGDGASESD